MSISMKVNIAMAVVAAFIAVIGGLVVVTQSLPIDLRHIGGGFLAAGVLMLLANVVLAIVVVERN